MTEEKKKKNGTNGWNPEYDRTSLNSELETIGDVSSWLFTQTPINSPYYINLICFHTRDSTSSNLKRWDAHFKTEANCISKFGTKEQKIFFFFCYSNHNLFGCYVFIMHRKYWSRGDQMCRIFTMLNILHMYFIAGTDILLVSFLIQFFSFLPLSQSIYGFVVVQFVVYVLWSHFHSPIKCQYLLSCTYMQYMIHVRLHKCNPKIITETEFRLRTKKKKNNRKRINKINGEVINWWN